MSSLERKLIKAELKQRGEEGCDTEDIAKRIASALEAKVSDSELSSLYDELHPGQRNSKMGSTGGDFAFWLFHQFTL